MSEYTQDQETFRDVVAKFLQAKSTPADVRRLMDTDEGFDRAVWQQLCQEVGLAGTHIPEEYGGFGFGPVELGIASEEMGRYLYCGPFLSSSVMAGYAVLNGASEANRQKLLPEIASGSTIATLVLDSVNAPEQVGRQLRATGNELDGTAPIVTDAQVADLLIVVAEGEDGLDLFSIASASEGVAIHAQDALDPTRKLSRVVFSGAVADKIGHLSEAGLEKTWNQISVALAHEMIGGAQQLFDSTLEYTKVRVQFGRPIGSFQALKHRCADLLLELEWAKAATHHAAFCLVTGEEQESASMAKAMASDVYMEAARAAVQLRGGIGFTWEEDTHLWYKRAKASEVFMGSPHMHRERLLSQMEEAS